MKKLKIPQGRTLVLYSGGMDSTVLLHATSLANPARTAALFMDFGQDAARRQREYAARTCTRLNLPIYYADAPQLVNLFLGTTRPPHILQTEHRDDVHIMDSEGATAFAAFAAQRLGFEFILHGLTASDLERWPSVSFEDMAKAMNQLLQVCGCITRYFAPFINCGISNEDVLQYAVENKLIFEETWSCVWGNRFHCGQCNGCRKRKTVLAAGNVSDDTIYAEPWPHEVIQ